MDVQGKVAIITGSSSGVGAETAKRLAGKGCNVVINYSKSEAGAKETAAACEALGVEARLVQANVAEDADCRRLVQEAIDAWGRLDVLVNNAGTTKFAAHDDMDALSAEDFQHIYAVNTIGPFQMIRAAAPHLKADGGGSIVNVASIAGVTGIGSSVAYAASKGALITMTKSLARVMGPEVPVNAVCPGFIQGKWLEQGMGKERYEQTKNMVEFGTTLQKAATAEQVAEAVVMLVEHSTLITGEMLLVDSGLHLGPRMVS